MEIKKAFETMKKELKKEISISGGFTMSAKQIENRTATYCVCNMISYEDEIKYHKAACDRVRSYKNWTDAEKERWISDTEVWVKYFEDCLEKYGTKENFANEMVNKIVNSKAFAKFCETVSGVRYCTEIKNNSGLTVEYLRFYY